MKITDEGARRLMCAILTQAVEDWQALRRNRVVDEEGGLTGKWVTYTAGARRFDDSEPREVVQFACTPYTKRSRIRGMKTVAEASELREFLVGEQAAQMAQVCGVERDALLRGIGIPINRAPMRTLVHDAAAEFLAARKAGLIRKSQAPELTKAQIDYISHGRTIATEPVRDRFPMRLRDTEMVQYRRDRNLTVQQAADSVGVSKSLWCMCEKRRRTRSWDLPASPLTGQSLNGSAGVSAPTTVQHDTEHKADDAGGSL